MSAGRPIPWYVRRPDLLRRELDELRGRYPNFLKCESSESGRLILHGSVTFFSELGQQSEVLVLDYPEEFPYVSPRVTPLCNSSLLEPHEPGALLDVKLLSARHQMGDASICLFERGDPGGGAEHVSGVDALRRAEEWLRAIRHGQLPKVLDSVESELEEHYARQGDVVLTPGAYGEHLPLRGRFLARLCRSTEQHPLYVVSHVEVMEGWIDDRLILGPLLMGWTKEQLQEQWWREVKPDALFAEADDTGILGGQFFTLAEEPEPVRNVLSLAALLFPDEIDPLKALAAQYRLALARASALVIGVRFPSRTAGMDWLIFRIALREQSLPKQAAPGLSTHGYVLDFGRDNEEILRSATLGILKVHDLRRPALQLRNQSRVPETAASLSVAVAGAGALGSGCVDLLAKAGVGKIAVWDIEWLDAGNVLRHSVGLHAVAFPKALLVAAAAASHNPYCQMESHLESVLSPTQLPAFLAADLSLSTIADDATELQLNQYAVAAGRTVYYLRALRAGTVGRLVRVRPGVDACLECLGHYQREGTHPLLDVLPAADEVVRRECGRPVLAASAADLASVAAIGARRLLDELAAQGEVSHWLWTTTGVDGHPVLGPALSAIAMTLTPHPSCQVCGPTELKEAVIDEAALQQISELSRAAFPQEIGGILVGRRVAGKVEILTASGPGPGAKAAPNRFTRDGVACQQFLEEAIRESGGELTYLGEWHSHPNGSSLPSTIDVSSLEEIARDPDYRTDTPILLIVGLARRDAEPEVGLTSFPCGRQGNELPLTRHF